jgi:hypothetical protein
MALMHTKVGGRMEWVGLVGIGALPKHLLFFSDTC